MLRIQRVDASAQRVDPILQGRIAGEWADLSGSECLDLLGSGQGIALDLFEVQSISRSGIAVLGRLARAGVKLFARSPLIADIPEQEGIDAGHGFRDANEGR